VRNKTLPKLVGIQIVAKESRKIQMLFVAQYCNIGRDTISVAVLQDPVVETAEEREWAE
jgi:hypothetical protein